MLSKIEDCIPALHRFATALAPNRQDSDDLVHDCLVRALDKLHTRRDDIDLRAWLFTIMHNLFVSQQRRLAARPDTEALDGLEVDHAYSGLAGQEDRIRWQELLRSLNSLPEDQRVVILFVSVGDLSYAEAAKVLGVPIGTVMSRLARGRERMRQLTQEPRLPHLREVK
jgi:RNA polymerase sigma-70 factor (ECF subfamily)